jgi:hypothetical protein
MHTYTIQYMYYHYVCMYVCMYIYMYVYVCVCVFGWYNKDIITIPKNARKRKVLYMGELNNIKCCCLFSLRYNPLWLYFHSPVAGFSLLVFEVS